MPRPTSTNRLSQKSRRLLGSTALVGSSSSSSSGRCSVAAASASRWRCPPLMRAGALRQQALELELGRELRDARVSRRAREPEDPRHELEILVHGQVVPQREPLRHVAKLGAHLLGVAGHLVAEHAHGAGRRLEQPAEHPDRRRLARSVRAQEAVDARARDGQVDVVDRDELAETPREAARLDGRCIARAGRLSVHRRVGPGRARRPAGSTPRRPRA